ncbi:MAG: ferredoxin--NADP reductase, partial [Pseudomonadota bacterium]
MTTIDGEGASNAPSYRRLTVKTVRDETDEARSFGLASEVGDAGLYNYRPGQFLTFRIPHEEGLITRSYSLSSAPCADPEMTVCVKRVINGRGSNWFNDHLRVGARIEATPPAGRFVMQEGDAPMFLFAGGSGITPCISLIKQALIETKRRVKLVYVNQNASSIIYREPLQRLERRFSDRFICEHWLDDREGLIEAPDIATAAEGWASANAYICGPGSLMDMAEETLSHVLGPEATILMERFVSPDDPSSEEIISHEPIASEPIEIENFRLTLDGNEFVVPIVGGQTLLDAALAAGIDAPCSCVEGHCGT